LVTYIILTIDPNAPSTAADGVIERLAGVVLLVSTGVGVYGQVYRYRRVATPLQRQQIKWLGLGLAGIAASALVNAFVNPFPTSLGDAPIGVRLLAFTLSFIGYTFFPIALTFAILRHRLWDIDLVLNRALVYGGLTAAIVGLYALIVGGLSALLHTQLSPVIAYIGVGFAALLFQPLRERLQRAVNRLMFGQRDEPYAVLARFGRQLETTPALNTLLPTIVHTIKETLKLPVVEIEVNSEQSSVNSAAENCSLFTFPLLYQAEPVGRLIVAPREGETELSTNDRRLLEDLARQAGVAVHAAQVTAELQNARERLVMTREEERRRLRRDLHDGLGPTLAALTAQAEAARDLIPTRPEQSITLLKDMVAQAQTATADIRRLVYNLRPPALDDLGLIGALQAQTQKVNQTNGLTVSLDAGTLSPLPAAVEVAAYRIVQEALANVVRHANAKQCRVALHIEREHLRLEIKDDGRGLPVKVEAGVGLTSMRERAEELGGDLALTANRPGTTVTARLPLTQAATKI
jgi:signal transduction histidine kinase